MLKTPILLIIFNRPETTKEVFAAIRNARPSRLFIAADAPRPNHPTDEERSKQTREVIATVDWPCEVFTLLRDSNRGCGLGVSEAINWFFEHNEEGIILEDDCVPHPDFFTFSTAMLNRYRDDKKIISINGSNLGYQPNESYSYTFSRFMNMWGWATWKDRAFAIDYKMEEWRLLKHPFYWIYMHVRQNLLDFDLNWYRLWKYKFDFVAKDQNFTWDWQWIFYQIKNKKLSIVPAFNLVTNIGFNENATHTFSKENPAANIPLQEMPQPLTHPAVFKPDLVYEEQFVKWVWCYHKRLPTMFYIKQFISRLTRRS
jgi:hypothetical protein